MELSKREAELIEGMIEVQERHAQTAMRMSNPMGKKQAGWDMERVALLKRILDEASIGEA